MTVTETDLARRAAEYFRDLGWVLYYEVALRGLSGRPDIVGTRGALMLICEVKTSLGLAVIEQAAAHLGEAHYVYVATPWTGRIGHATTRWLQSLGVGYLRVGTSVEAHCEEGVAPTFMRRAATGWVSRLKPEHQT